jgi:hypothetical protein
LKPNSQGAIADTPDNKEIESPGGHFTPKNPELSDGGGSKDESSETDKDLMHPMQVQQLGNKPIEDDGTTRDGENTPEAAKAGVGDEGAEESGESEEKTGAWGIPMDSEEESDNPEDEEEGEEVEIDIKEKDGFKETMEHKFKRLANIKEVGAREPIIKKFKMDKEKGGMVKADEAGALSEVKKLVAEMKAKGKTGPMLERAEKYLSNRK